MKSLHYILFVSLLLCAGSLSVRSQNPAPPDERDSPAKRGPVFRANKDQVSAAQTMLKAKGLYAGQATGKLDPATRESIKSYQSANGLRATGTLNRATLEKMGIELTEKQRAIPASASSLAPANSSKRRKTGSSRSASDGDGDKPRRSPFRATKEQITAVQRLLKTGGMYNGDQTGKLDDSTREGLKKYQEAKGLKATGTLNQVTLEKMGIALTDRQKGGEGAN